jgi:hypothetical protein
MAKPVPNQNTPRVLKRVSMPDTNVTRRKINYQPAIGLARIGELDESKSWNVN